jgi:hypothetical protein
MILYDQKGEQTVKKVRRVLSPRLIASGFALALASFALLSSPAQAVIPDPLPTESGCQGIGSVTTYYANGQAVGHYIHWCNGVCEGSGDVTPDFNIAYLMCANPGGGEP